MKNEHSPAGDVFIAWLPFLIAFAAVPLAVFVPNLVEFDRDLTVILPFLGAAVLALPALLALRLLRPRARGAVSGGLFFLGLWLLMSDALAPLDWGLLDGESELGEPLGNSIKEALLAALLVVLWVKTPARLVRTFGIPATAVILVSQLVLLTLGALRAADRPAAGTAPAAAPLPTPAPAPETARGNIYHLVFDGYGGARFAAAVDRLGLADELSGFTFFDRALANYHVTDASVPSYLLGRFYRQGSFTEWQRSAMTGGLRRWLDDAGYRIEVYSPDRARFWMYDGADLVRTSQEISRSYFRGSDTLRLAQVALVRLAPNPLRRETLSLSERLFGYLIARINGIRNAGTFSRYALYKRLSVPLYRQFLDAEPERAAAGRYVYVHVILPHSPFVWDGECGWADSTGYDEQTLCATRLMAETVATLRRLGRHDQALVILQSDHGYHGAEGGEPDFETPAPPEVRASVGAAMTYLEVDGYLRRIRPLMAIKPPGAAGRPLETSSAPAQLIDLPATVAHLAGIAAPPTDGISLFDPAAAAPREIHLYAGIYTRDLRGRVLVLGQTRSRAELAHVSYTAGRGWKTYPNLRAQTD